MENVDNQSGSPSKPNPELSVDLNYKYPIDIAGQDAEMIKLKLHDFGLSKREQEIIANWLGRDNLDRFTLFTIGYDEEGNLILTLIGPSSRAMAKYEKKVILPIGSNHLMNHKTYHCSFQITRKHQTQITSPSQ